eukprot:TRINITY_DN27224_c0_g1_i1.p1 TRINITY_DN27224_c0_g1~~TRINITY_DN27224_c0_g1_i1.p1  ORF type:complete len:962 (+),score=190.94 TRINITY_DN27224_c0_g1_i1:119-3004(+)
MRLGKCIFIFTQLWWWQVYDAEAQGGTSTHLSEVRRCLMQGGRVDFMRDSGGFPRFPRCLQQACPKGSIEVYQSCVAPEASNQAQEIAITIHAPCTSCGYDQGMEMAGKVWLALTSALQIPMQESKATVLLMGSQLYRDYPLRHFTLHHFGQTPLVTSEGGSLKKTAYDFGERWNFFMAVKIHTARIPVGDALYEQLRVRHSGPLLEVLGQHTKVGVFEFAARRTPLVWSLRGLVASYQVEGLPWGQEPPTKPRNPSATVSETSADSKTTAQPPRTTSSSRTTSRLIQTVQTTTQRSYIVQSSCPCYKSWLGDGLCDKQCDREDCGWDAGDCSPSTSTTSTTSGIDSATSTTSTTSTTLTSNTSTSKEGCRCHRTWLGDGSCDQYCNTEECLWDYGDCRATTQSATTTQGRTSTRLNLAGATDAQIAAQAARDASLEISLTVEPDNTTGSSGQGSWHVEASMTKGGPSWTVDDGLRVKEEGDVAALSPVFLVFLGFLVVIILPVLCIFARRRVKEESTRSQRVEKVGVAQPEAPPSAWSKSSPQAAAGRRFTDLDEEAVFRRTWGSTSTSASGQDSSEEDSGSWSRDSPSKSPSSSWWDFGFRTESKDAKVWPEPDLEDPEQRASPGSGGWRGQAKRPTPNSSKNASQGPRPESQHFEKPAAPETIGGMSWHARHEADRHQRMREQEGRRKSEERREKEEQDKWTQQFRKKEEEARRQREAEEHQRKLEKQKQEKLRQEQKKQRKEEYRKHQDEEQRRQREEEHNAKRREEEEQYRRKHEEERQRQQKKQQQDEEQRKRKAYEQQKKAHEQQQKQKQSQQEGKSSWFGARWRSSSAPPPRTEKANSSKSGKDNKGSNWTPYAGGNMPSGGERERPRAPTAEEKVAKEKRERELQAAEKQANHLLENVVKQLDSTRSQPLDARKKVFRDLQRQLHPDKNLECQEAAKLAFQKLMDSRGSYLA